MLIIVGKNASQALYSENYAEQTYRRICDVWKCFKLSTENAIKL